MESIRSFSDIRQLIEGKNASCEDIVLFYLKKIEENRHLNAFLEVFSEESLQRARIIDQKIQQGKAGRLAGMVVGIKDVFCLKDHKIQAASKILEGFVSQFTATALQRLLDEDAIIIGRLNCDEFAMGSSNENSAYGPVLNAADNSRVPGGSSGGSAVAVQAGLCTVALGSDTGGSIRQPAAFCDVVGIKPTYSRVSRYGLLAYASSFDCVGVFSSNIEDNALVLEIMAGADEYDSTVSRSEVPAYSKNLLWNGPAKVAYVKELLDGDGVQEDIKQNLSSSLQMLKEAGHEVIPVSFPLLKYALPTYYILITAESSSNLSRYDGVKYGYRTRDAKGILDMYKKTRTQAFGEEVRRRIMLGTFVLSASYYDAFYTKAQKVRNLIRAEAIKILTEHDFLLMPVTPTTAFKLGEHNKNPLEMYLADLFTVQASVAGIPAISVPNGYDANNLPIGLQIIANYFEEEQLYQFANTYFSRS
ncbi:MAG: Asp-tRNA(Asn)/Glu-tRNA(Gln) amidotransferase subunit GatA [Cyclobacteriaceae bacterium]|nr:Asp-tRNA(Asn)/Glu-tRNA(Gln) amidotransferase subunit GatA [Cyclobacteriaceae bacterium]